jgi:alkaline phosphatase D
MFRRDVGDTAAPGRFDMDKWDGYAVSRDRIFSRLVEANTPNPIVLSGDVHVHYGADLKTDFSRPDSAVVGTEFTNSSVTSGGDGAEVSAAWDRLRRNGPHLKYHSSRRGYIACTATPKTMRADFKILDKVTVPNLPVRIGGSLVVEAGKKGSVLV